MGPTTYQLMRRLEESLSGSDRKKIRTDMYEIVHYMIGFAMEDWMKLNPNPAREGGSEKTDENMRRIAFGVRAGLRGAYMQRVMANDFSVRDGKGFEKFIEDGAYGMLKEYHEGKRSASILIADFAEKVTMKIKTKVKYMECDSDAAMY